MSALTGIRVLDLTRLLPGGFCSLLLADFGADVVKVEDTGAGDYIRFSAPHYEGAEPSAGSALFLALNRGKRSIRIDLKSEAGREAVLRLAVSAWAMRGCASSTRGSSTAPSRATARTAPTATAPATT
jgi:crotonobetainyl-CoA:carnitine CoA-transferase CaiB-like acyl-CoA transferase